VVTPAGVRHLALPWSHDHELAIEGQPVADAVMVRRLAAKWPVGEGRQIPVVAVTRDLEVREWRRRYRRLTVTDWSIEGDGGDRTASVDERGLPIWPASRGETSGAGEPTEWPLELDPSSLASSSWTTCGQRRPRRTTSVNLVDKSVVSPLAAGYRRPCSKGLWTESSVADANQRR
jgi:hypothetical protein